jgi:indolepyruvate ferredoxin oxidoreductase beta subunit
VEVYVRFRKEVYTPHGRGGRTNFVVALEAVRAYRYLRPGAVLLVNKRVIQPPGRRYDWKSRYKLSKTVGLGRT